MRRRTCWRRSSAAVLRRQAAATADPAQSRAAGAGADRRGAHHQGERVRGGKRSTSRIAQRGREARRRRARRAGTRARHWNAGSPRAPGRRSCSIAWRSSSGCPRPAERIEVYDNSHIMGTNAYRGHDRRWPGGFAKQAYRKFSIKTAIAPGDDFGMMRERCWNGASGARSRRRRKGRGRRPGPTWC
jgi:hypothetical protein